MERIAIVITSRGEILKPESAVANDSNPNVKMIDTVYRRVGDAPNSTKKHRFYYRKNAGYYLATNLDKTHDALYFIGEGCETLADLYAQYRRLQEIARGIAERTDERERKMFDMATERYRLHKVHQPQVDDANYRLTNSLFGGCLGNNGKEEGVC